MLNPWSLQRNRMHDIIKATMSSSVAGITGQMHWGGVSLAQQHALIMCLQVRAAATMGGNLTLTKEQGLESDVATLMSALQAQVGVTSLDKEDLRYPFQVFQLPSSVCHGHVVLLQDMWTLVKHAGSTFVCFSIRAS